MTLSILPLDLQDDLVHEFAGLLQLGELLLKVNIEIAEVEHLLAVGHGLDPSEQVVGHVVGGLENVVLLTVKLTHSLVLNLVNGGVLLFDELLHAFETHVHHRYRLLYRGVQGFEVALSLVCTIWTLLRRKLVGWRVVELVFVEEFVLVVVDAQGAKRQVVGETEHVDGLLVLPTVGILLDGACLGVALAHLTGKQFLALRG